jgi:hypothetical protein
MISRESFARWLMAGIVWCSALGLLGAIVLHTYSKAPWRTTTEPVVVMSLILLAWYLLMFWARRQFKRSHDLRIGTVVTGLFVMAEGVGCFRYAGKLGFVSPDAVSANYIGLSIFMTVVIVVSVVVVSFWRRAR